MKAKTAWILFFAVAVLWGGCELRAMRQRMRANEVRQKEWQACMQAGKLSGALYINECLGVALPVPRDVSVQEDKTHLHLLKGVSQLGYTFSLTLVDGGEENADASAQSAFKRLVAAKNDFAREGVNFKTFSCDGGRALRQFHIVHNGKVFLLDLQSVCGENGQVPVLANGAQQFFLNSIEFF